MEVIVTLADALRSSDHVRAYLDYKSYCTQREEFPDTRPEEWAGLFPHWRIFERVYQQERRARPEDA